MLIGYVRYVPKGTDETAQIKLMMDRALLRTLRTAFEANTGDGADPCRGDDAQGPGTRAAARPQPPRSGRSGRTGPEMPGTPPKGRHPRSPGRTT